MASKSGKGASKRVDAAEGSAAASKSRVKPAAQTSAPSPIAEPEKQTGAKALLRAGLKALNDVRDDVVTRQSRVFEALLGLDTTPSASDRSARETKLLSTGVASGIEKFEEIFDQRVARSMERLGMPSPQALAALVQQLEAINAHLQRIQAPPPPKKRAAPRSAASKPASRKTSTR
jgi:hypothetical protein